MRNGCAQPDLANLNQHIRLSMIKRGWTAQEIREAYDQGLAYPATDVTNGNTPATRFVHPTSGKSVVVNNATGKIIHVGGEDFQY